MKITITNYRLNEHNAATLFFDTLVEFGGVAFIIHGWKITDGKMYPPQIRSGRTYFQSVFCSPSFAKAVQVALIAAGLEKMTTIEPESWVSAKWGKAMLEAAIPESPEFAYELWNNYR